MTLICGRAKLLKKFIFALRAIMLKIIFVFCWLVTGCTKPSLEQYRYKLSLTSQVHESAREIKLLESQLTSDPQNPTFKTELAEAYFNEAKKTGQDEFLQQALKLTETSLENPSLKMIKARILENHHQFQSAVRISQEVLTKAPQSRTALKTLVTSHLALGNLSEASKFASVLVSAFPRTGTFSLRGLVHLSMGRSREGVFDLQRALEVEDLGEEQDSSWARCLLARYFLSQGQLREAHFLLDEALRITPQSAFAMDLKGQAYAIDKEFESAGNMFERAFSVSRQLVHLRHQAELNLQADKPQLASDLLSQVEKLIRQELSMNRNDHRLELVKVLLRRKTGKDVMEAQELLKQELLVRQSAEVFYLLAQAYADSEQWPLAQAEIENALRSGAKESRYYLLAASIYQNQRNEGRAQLYKDLAELSGLTKEAGTFL